MYPILLKRLNPMIQKVIRQITRETTPPSFPPDQKRLAIYATTTWALATTYHQYVLFWDWNHSSIAMLQCPKAL
jgi:hypothetical protein